MLPSVVELFLNILLKLLDIVGSHDLEKHFSFFIFLLSESALLRPFDVREFFKVFEVFDMVCLFLSKFIGVYFLLLR